MILFLYNLKYFKNTSVFQNKIYLLNKILPIRKLNKDYKAIINLNAGLYAKQFNCIKKVIHPFQRKIFEAKQEIRFKFVFLLIKDSL